MTHDPGSSSHKAHTRAAAEIKVIGVRHFGRVRRRHQMRAALLQQRSETH
jgi:hypothetical protein